MHLKQSFKSIAFGYIKKAMHCLLRRQSIASKFCSAKPLEAMHLKQSFKSIKNFVFDARAKRMIVTDAPAGK